MPMIAERTIRSRWRLSLAQQFLLGSLVVLLLSMAGVGGWVARQIEEGVVQRSAATTALYVDSLVTPALQELAEGDDLSPEAEDRLTWLFEDTPLGREVLLFQVWDRDRQIVFSTVPDMVGQAVTTDPELDRAMAGTVQAQIGQAEGSELLPTDSGNRDLLEIYSPLRSRGTNEIIGVAEFYYALDDLREEIANAQRQSWLVLGAVTFLVYVLLAAFVRRASETIERQQLALSSQVNELSALLRQNEELHQRARGAAARAVALNERFLRRISADLHDGPAQDISLALLRLDGVAEELDTDGSGPSENEDAGEIGLIQASLRRALQELRTTSSGILLPQLSALSIAGVIDSVSRAHRRRTGAIADVTMHDVPEQAPLATKIAIYRILQEALNNAARHATGARVAVEATGMNGQLRIEITDDGPGFDPSALTGSEDRLGLAGMRERTESLGGTLAIESCPGAGTRLVAELPMAGGGDDD